MTPFEYLSVLISIVLGLGLTELLSRVQRLLQERQRVRPHWLPVTWSVLIFVALVQWWWAAFGFHTRMTWNFFSFLLILLVPILYYLAASLVLPGRAQEDGYDLRAHYFATRPLFFGAAATATLLETVRALIAGDVQAMLLNLAGTALLASLAVVRRPGYHAFGTITAATLLAVFIFAETLRIA